MNKLTIRKAAPDVQEIVLLGDARRRPEPMHVRLRFPGGELELVRCADGSYWAHVYVATPDNEGWDPNAIMGQLAEARLDIHGEATSQADVGDFEDPGLYHLAVRIERAKR
jgi:hypothetical protein